MLCHRVMHPRAGVHALPPGPIAELVSAEVEVTPLENPKAAVLSRCVQGSMRVLLLSYVGIQDLSPRSGHELCRLCRHKYPPVAPRGCSREGLPR